MTQIKNKNTDINVFNKLEFTKKELIFLLLLSNSFSRKQIIEKMNIKNTYEYYSIYRVLLKKLNAKNTIQAVVAGIKYGIIRI